MTTLFDTNKFNRRSNPVPPLALPRITGDRKREIVEYLRTNERYAPTGFDISDLVAQFELLSPLQFHQNFKDDKRVEITGNSVKALPPILGWMNTWGWRTDGKLVAYRTYDGIIDYDEYKEIDDIDWIRNSIASITELRDDAIAKLKRAKSKKSKREYEVYIENRDRALAYLRDRLEKLGSNEVREQPTAAALPNSVFEYWTDREIEDEIAKLQAELFRRRRPSPPAPQPDPLIPDNAPPGAYVEWKTIKGRKYPYLRWREGGYLRSKYLKQPKSPVA